GYLGFSSGVSGVCGGSTTITGVAAVPSGYSANVTILGTLFYVTLSSDSKTINAVNSANSACNGNAIRSGSEKLYDHTNSITALLLAIIVIKVFKQ
ncbi:unnamed protein product, partial [Didymodactylos carnosus]